MRISSALFLALPLLAAAEEQKPLKAWLDKLSSYIPSAVQHPIENAAAKSAKVHVTHVTMYNLKDTLVPNGQPQEWWVYVTGGNTTCFGQCKITGQAWNVSLKAVKSSQGEGCSQSYRNQQLSSKPLRTRRSSEPSIAKPRLSFAISGLPNHQPYGASTSQLL